MAPCHLSDMVRSPEMGFYKAAQSRGLIATMRAAALRFGEVMGMHA